MSSLKKNVSLEQHLNNLRSIESQYGHLISFSDKHPLFKNYVLDENMFKGFLNRKKQTVFKYLLNFERGMLSLYAEMEEEGEEYKIKIFYMDIIEQ